MTPFVQAPASRWLARIQKLGTILFGLSILLLAWNFLGMGRTIELRNLGAQRSGKRDDSAENGASRSNLARSASGLALDCTLRSGYAWPYCGYFFSLGVEPAGVDLSGFDTVTVDVEWTGPGPHAMRLYVRNFEPDISRAGQWETQKVNEVEFDIPAHGPITIPLALMRTAAWWNAAQHVPLLKRAMRIDHATDVELYTGGATVLGSHQLLLRSVRFEGKLISQHHLLLWLAGVWTLFGIVWLSLGLAHDRANLRASKARLAKLSSINRALELETQELAHKVHIDALTGALNRQGLRNVLLKQLVAEDGNGFECAIMFIDIDHFKRINDGHGHSVGDAVLRHFAAAIQREIRVGDVLVRWGGEEFLVVCPNTDLDGAQVLGEKLRRCILGESWPAALAVTASFGVAATHADENFSDAIDRADTALYQAKKRGRDRVELAGVTPTSVMAEAPQAARPWRSGDGPDTRP